MCIGGKQPSAPVNKPAYAPEDAYKHFEASKTDEAGNKTVLETPDQAAPSRTSVPQVKPRQEQIRM